MRRSNLVLAGFFVAMQEFYASGDCVALLLERAGAVAAWRGMLGPGDPSVGRVVAPESIRARFGTSKQCNAAHGADSVEAVRREVAYVFGTAPCWCEPGAAVIADDCWPPGVTVRVDDDTLPVLPAPTSRDKRTLAARVRRLRARRRGQGQGV